MSKEDEGSSGRPPRSTKARRAWLKSLQDGQKHAVYRVRGEFAFPTTVYWVPESRLCAFAKSLFDDWEREREGCFYTFVTGPRELFDSNGVQLGCRHPDWLISTPSRTVRPPSGSGRYERASGAPDSDILDEVADLFEKSKNRREH